MRERARVDLGAYVGSEIEPTAFAELAARLDRSLGVYARGEVEADLDWRAMVGARWIW